jgi:hypothetical protein
MLVPVDIPPGISRNGTRYQTRGRWYDANLIRWVEGVMRPVGGWTRVGTTAPGAKIRTLFPWASNGGSRWLCVPTAGTLLVTKADGVYYNITPAGFTQGSDDYVEQLGYGGGTYGSGTYGTPRTGGSYVPPMTWQVDSWGEYLVGCARGDGKLYQWTLSTGTPAAQITGSPTNCLGLIVSDQRHLIAFGAGGNRRLAKWSAKENNADWTPSATNEAGSFELQTSGEYVRAVRVRGQILVCTTVDAHVMNYIGQPYIFARERVGLDCGLIGPNAIATAESFAVWMGDKGFWMFDGGAVRALPSDVNDYVFSDINLFNGVKFVAGHNGQFGEVWFFYCSSGATEPDRYVAWNYREKHWTVGSLARTAWCDRGVFPTPFAADTSSVLYRQEEGFTNNGASRVSSIFVESGALELQDGDAVTEVMQVVPDEGTRGEVSVTFRGRYTPNGTEYTTGPYLVRNDGYTDTRVSGRQLTLRIAPTVDDDFRVGKFRLDVNATGRR